MEIKGIDVSVYQGVIDWKKVKASGVKFAIIRAGVLRYNGSVNLDTKFHDNVKGAIAVGIEVGVYMYSFVQDTMSAVVAAKNTLALVKPYKITYPICFDIEETADVNGYNKKTKAQNNAICKAFLDEIERNKYYGMLYTYTYFASAHLDMAGLTQYDVWIADFRGYCGYTGKYGIWQFSSTGSVDGIIGNVDLNVGYRDYAELIARLGMNNLTPPTTPPVEPPTVPTKKPIYLLVGGFDEGNMARGEALKEFLDAEKIYNEWTYLK